MSDRLPKRAVVLTVALAALALLIWRFPLFHVVSLSEVHASRGPRAFEAEAAARRFWATQLLPAANRATDAKELLDALGGDARAARQRFGRSFGITDRTLFLFQGTAQVTTLESEAVVVTLDGSTKEVRLSTALVFGNRVRDASGLLDVGAYARSGDFNELSAQLNRLVETQVTPRLREGALAGKRLRFAACAELSAGAPPKSLPAVPIKVEWL